MKISPVSNMASRTTFICECGCSLRPSSMYRHLKSVKHKRMLAKNSVLKQGIMLRCSCRRDVLSDDFLTHITTREHKSHSQFFPSVERAKMVLELVFENSEELTESKYLETCNMCQDIYKFHQDPDKYSKVICVNSDGIYRLNNQKIILLPNI
jgi:hypothetical protein